MQKNFQCEKTVQRKGGNLERYAYSRQGVDAKKTNAMQTMQPMQRRSVQTGGSMLLHKTIQFRQCT